MENLNGFIEQPHIPAEKAEEIKAFCRLVRQNIGQQGRLPSPPDGVTVRYTHTYGSGSAQIFYRGAQIASA